MKVDKLIIKLKANGCVELFHGKEYDVWFSPITNGRFRVPRYKTQEIPIGTLKSIIKQAGI